MNIETERLEIVPLTARQLRLWVEDTKALEGELNCFYKAEPLEGEFLEIVKGQIKVTEKDIYQFMWHSFWLIIRKEDRVVIGSLDFKDIPNAKGQVEIGYGLGKDYGHHGYMTEAVRAMCDWGFKQERVLNIIAETEVDGFASQRVLKRCGFKQYKQEETLWWIL